MLKWFRRREAARRAELETAVRDAVKASTDRLQADIAALRATNDALTASLATVTKERDTFRSQVREQTEADVVLLSLRVAFKAISGDSRDPSLEAALAQKRAQLALLQQQSPILSYGGLGNIGGIGGIGTALAGLWPH